MIKEYSFQFNDLKIVPEELAELLGFESGTLPEPFPKYVGDALKKGQEITNIRGGFKIFESVDINTVDCTICVEDQLFTPGKIVTAQLKKSRQIALFACTAGSEITTYAKKVGEKDIMKEYILDVLGSVVVEKAMDKIQNLLYIDCKGKNTNISDRYSPGYCNWNVNEQQKLFTLLPETFCGISLSGSSLMSPVKSVSGFIGIGPALSQKGYQCKYCDDTACIYNRVRRVGVEN